ncbi:MAG TPA: DEAD/DEAH box helicase, partial [Myxococcus sp.]|nr:DEAD/DEAH box helicase [Myxococcus sp.]
MGPGQRVIVELSTLEKALSKTDFSAEKGPLQAIVRALRPMRLKSLEDLDLNTRGRLITTLLRVQRQPKPPAPEASAAPAEGAAPSEAAPAEAAPAEAAAPAEGATPDEGAAPAEGSAAPAEGAAPAAPAAPAGDPAK